MDITTLRADLEAIASGTSTRDQFLTDLLAILNA